MNRRVCQWAALVVLTGLQGLWLFHDLPWFVRLVHGLFFLLAIWRPAQALIAMALTGPVIVTLAAAVHSPVTGDRHLEVLVLAVITGGLWHWRPGEPTRTGAPALLLGAVALLSAAVAYPTRMLAMEGDAYYFVSGPFWDPLFFGMLLAEGAALVWTVECLCRRDPTIGLPLIGSALLGHAAAELLTLRELLQTALRSDAPMGALFQLFSVARVHSQYDVNAAAAALILVILAAGGVLSRRRVAWMGPALLLTLVGVWQTGSRTALAALAVASVPLLLAASPRQLGAHHWRRLALAAGILAVGLLLAFSPGRRDDTLSGAVGGRAVMLTSGLRMAWDSPLVGIGVGRFREVSESYGAAGINRYVLHQRQQDNAHNNFVQVLAELGALGFAAFLWLLVAAGSGLGTWAQRPPGQRWLLAGLVASCLTWLTGHPLLVPHAAFVFWVFAGMAASYTSATAAGRFSRTAIIVGLVIAAASAPWQIRRHRQRAPLEHRGLGLSLWQPGMDGVRFRESGARFTLFLPKKQIVHLPLRPVPGVPLPLTVRVTIDQHSIDAVSLTTPDWQLPSVGVPDRPEEFVTVEFEVLGPDGGLADCGPCVQIGRQVVR